MGGEAGRWGGRCEGEQHERTEKVAGKKKKRGLLVNSTQQSRRRGNLTLAINCFFSFWPHCVAYGILVLQPGIEPEPLHWKGRVLTTGP